MAKIGIYYGTDTGMTEDIAKQIQKKLKKQLNDKASMNDVCDTDLSDVSDYDLLIMGIPTWYYGELQTDWEKRWEELEGTDFSGKTVALFGLGDQEDYAEYYLDAMGDLHDVVVAKGANIIGYWPNEGYDFEESKALTEDKSFFYGLALDEDRQPELTEERVDQWLEQIIEEWEEISAS